MRSLLDWLAYSKLPGAGRLYQWVAAAAFRSNRERAWREAIAEQHERFNTWCYIVDDSNPGPGMTDGERRLAWMAWRDALELQGDE